MTDSRAPQPLAAEFAELLGEGGFNPLRLALHGQNAPLAAQYVHDLLRNLPREIAARPDSPEFRSAMRDLWRTRDVYLEANQADIRSGVWFLDSRGLLPRWVYPAFERNIPSDGEPLAAQYVTHLLGALPGHLSRHPGGREFRSAMRHYWAQRDVYLEATRADVRAGIESLSSRGALPTWLYNDDANGAR